MHEMNREKLDRGYGWSWLCELIRQLDERYVKREEQHYHIEIDDPQARLSGTMDPEVQPKACPHDLFNSCEECYTDGQREPEQPKKCKCIDDHWITDICDYNTYPKFCCYCGLPLPKEEKKP